MAIAGLLLAAGAGMRMGMPKALVVGEDGRPWSVRAAELLRRVGCDPVVVVLGDAADDAAALLPDWATPLVAEDWVEGMGASLRRGLDFLLDARSRRLAAPDAALVTLVDLPGLAEEAARRVLATGGGAAALARAVYGGVPGHPVLIGSAHWAPLRETLRGDVGGREYLREHGALRVECGDLGGGEDQDAPLRVE